MSKHLSEVKYARSERGWSGRNGHHKFRVRAYWKASRQDAKREIQTQVTLCVVT